MRNRLPLLLPILSIIGCVTSGCGPKNEGAPAQHGTSGTQAAGQLKVAMVTDTGGIADQSFNAGCWSGIQRAEKELGIAKPRYLESREQADYISNLSSLAGDKKHDLVVAVGYLMVDAFAKAAPQFPDTKFVLVDGKAPDVPNAASLTFREEEGTFLVGYLAARMSKTGAVGFVGGMEGPLIKKFEAGYIAGARTANPAVRVLVKYVGGWNDNVKGREIAEFEAQQGADIVFHAAGKSGLGVLDAMNARGPGYYGIGVDKDQDSVHPGRVLTSMMKRVDTAIFDTIKSVQDGTWKPGVHEFGLKEGGIHLSPMTHTKKDVPPDVLAKLDQLTKMIIDGKISIPKTDEDLQNFKAPKL